MNRTMAVAESVDGIVAENIDGIVAVAKAG